MRADIRRCGARAAMLALLAAFALALAFAAPSSALADASQAPQAQKSKYHQLSGTVYFSRSDDAKFCMSDGADPGIAMINAPIDLAEVCKVDLDDYDLGDYKLAAPADADYEYECTMLQLFVYAAQRFSSAGAEGMQVTGPAHSSYIKQYWGADENFLYYVNGAYPMDDSLGAGMGATSDVVRLKDGDLLSVAHYSDWSFYTDDDAGFRFFLDGDGRAARAFVVKTGEPLQVRLVRAVEGASEEDFYVPEAGRAVWWGSSYDYSAENATALGRVVTDESGRALVSFDEPGTYYLYSDGVSSAATGAVVGSPACVRVLVSDNPAPMASVPTAVEGLVYDGAEHVGVAAVEGVVLSGACSAADAGDYRAYAVPAEGFTWQDGSRHVKEIPWSIARASIADAKLAVDAADPARPVASVALGGAVLGDDSCTIAYSVSCDSDARTAVVRATASGIGNYAGTVSTEVTCVCDAVRMALEPARAAYTGKRIAPSVQVVAGGSQLASADYELRYVNAATGVSSRVAPTAVGRYRVVARLSSEAAVAVGFSSAEAFALLEVYDPEAAGPADEPSGPDDSAATARKAANSLRVTVKTITAKAKKLAKKARTFKAVAVSKAQGKLAYKLVKVKAKKKLLKQAKKKIKLAASGKLKLKRGLKKGIYKAIVRVSAAGDATHKAASKTVTATIKVK